MTETPKYKITADLVELAREVGHFQFDPENANTNHDLDGIAESLDEYSQRRAIVARSADGQPPFIISAGEGTFRAATERLGWSHVAAVIVVEDAITAAGYGLVDNATAKASHYDPVRLAAVLRKTKSAGLKVGSAERALSLIEKQRQAAGDLRPPVGSAVNRDLWDKIEETRKAAENGSTLPAIPNETPADELAQQRWQVKLGDVWKVGRHYVTCGDSREPASWDRLFDAAGIPQADGVFTSPIYAEQRKKSYGGVPADEYLEWWSPLQANVRPRLKDDGSFFVNIKPHCEKGERVLYVHDLVVTMKRGWKWCFIDEFTWVKTNAVPGYWPNRLKNGFEPIFQFSKQTKIKARFDNIKKDPAPATVTRVQTAINAQDSGRKVYRSGYNADLMSEAYQSQVAGVLPSNVIELPTESTGVAHDAPFPPALAMFFLEAFSDPGDVWVDCFDGSGSMILGAEEVGRVGLGIELVEKTVAYSIDRLVTIHGLDAERVVDG